MEEAFTSYLLEFQGLSALISRRFFFEELPQGTILPAVVVIKISDVKSHSLTGQDKLESPIYQFTTYAFTKAQARAVANQIKLALCDYQDTMNGVVVQKIELQNEMSSLEKSPDGTIRVYTEDLEFEINFIK